MDTYAILRQLDYLKAAVDNLIREACNSDLFPIYACMALKSVRSPKKKTIAGLFRQEIGRIDFVSNLLHSYIEDHIKDKPSPK